MNTSESRKILVVDDEPDVTDLLSYKLTQAGYITEVINNPLQIMGVAHSFLPDLIILDVMMPDINGLQICRMIRADEKLNPTPIIFLTAKGEVQDRVKGLEVGADDYLGKPFDSRELLLRIESLLKRTQNIGKQESPHGLKIGAISLDPERHIAAVNEKKIELTATEFKLLHLLMERKGRVQSREHLLINVWNYDADIETRTVDTHVRRLRDKLGEAAGVIETVRGVGYRITDT